MKRIILAAMAALTLATPVLALDVLPASQLPRTRRVAFVQDDNYMAFNYATQRIIRKNLDRGMGGFAAALERAGCKVDFYTTDFFLKSVNMTNSEATLWKNLGTTYGLVVVNAGALNGTKTDGATNEERFYRPDSTNAQLLIVWSAGNRSAGSGADSSWAIGVGVGGSNTTTGRCSGSGSPLYGSRIAYRPYGTTDTLYVEWSENAVCTTTPNAAVTSVVRLLEPLSLTAGLHPFPSNTDSGLVDMPAVGDSTATSTAGNFELLGPAWRVYFTGGRWVDNWLPQGNDPKYVRNLAMIPYAMAARYLTLDPIKIAVEMDDVFDMSPSNTGNVRWSNAGMDSLLNMFMSYGCRPAFDVNPLHAYEYMRGDNPTWEVPWVGDAWTWPRKWGMSWVHHSHDSSGSRITSNLVGRFGGYSGTAGNGLGSYPTATSGHFMFSYHRARAFWWQPGNNEPEKRYGIYNRLMHSDSLRAIVCPECIVPPYLSFPDNQVLPVNWRTRTVANNWAAYRSPSADSLCTVDSTFLAMARGLRVPNGGTLYIRGTFHNGIGDSSQAGYRMRAWGYRSIKNTYMGSEAKVSATDSVIAHTPFLYPGEKIVVQDALGVTGPAPYKVTVRNIGTVSFDTNSQDIQTVRGLSSLTLAKLLGFWSGVQDGAASGTIDSISAGVGGNVYGDVYGNSPYSKDINGVYGTNSNEHMGFTRDHPRIIYFHPLNYAGTTGVTTISAGKNSQTVNFERGILKPVRALNTLAGYTIFQWVYPWEVYSK